MPRKKKHTDDDRFQLDRRTGLVQPDDDLTSPPGTHPLTGSDSGLDKVRGTNNKLPRIVQPDDDLIGTTSPPGWPTDDTKSDDDSGDDEEDDSESA